MKKTLLSIVVLLLVGFLLFSKTTTKTIAPPPSLRSKIATVQPKPQKRITITYNNKEYVAYYALLSGRKIALIPNFTQKKAAKTLVKENNCGLALNAGFYTKTSQPLGLLIIDGKRYGNMSDDRSLLTGFFYLDTNGQPRINGQPNPKAQTIFQAGPLIVTNKPFSTATDEQTRRIVIVEEINGRLYALAIVFKDSDYSGPLLSELPPLLFSINKPFRIKQALNLDGGSASFFFEKDGIYLAEQTNVGSVICVV